MFKAFALVLIAMKVRPGVAGLPTARVTPLRAAVPQTASRRSPNRHPLTCAWVLDAQSGRLSRKWTLEPSA
jgi:hypothetical protein